MNWPLVLEFTKVLAGPVAAVVSVYLVSALALRTYRGQKTIERRLDWYERLARQIDGFVATLTAAGTRWKLDQKSPATEKATTGFLESAAALRTLLAGTFMYATAAGYDEVNRLASAVREFLDQFRATLDPSNNQAVVDVCHSVSIALANDIRGEMGMTLLGPPRPSRIRKVWSTLAGRVARR